MIPPLPAPVPVSHGRDRSAASPGTHTPAESLTEQSTPSEAAIGFLCGPCSVVMICVPMRLPVGLRGGSVGDGPVPPKPEGPGKEGCGQ